MTRRSFPNRIATCPEHFGEKISVDIDTHLTGCIRFSSGAIATITTSFDIFYTYPPHFEIFGTKGTLVVPDPNIFGGQVLFFRPEDEDSGMRLDRQPYFGFRNIPLMFDYKKESRGLGLADMCKAIETGRDWRANYKQQYHVLEILTSFTKASESGQTLTLESRYERPAPMKNNPLRGILDD